ncbi:hypothetical protein D9615_005414 [Tricholomella constricta]|uniref:Uncharacterized protein n=1 Tax=Tricholomella constricta TaxID=117010 RepID=A0A8H5HE36_9AGAR|nr:hypothetical protein D9615_005414 [Tricholomella constricta]
MSAWLNCSFDRDTFQPNYLDDPKLLVDALSKLPNLTHLSWLDPEFWAHRHDEPEDHNEDNKEDSGRRRFAKSGQW